MTATRPSPRRILSAPETQRSKRALTPGSPDVPLGPFAFAFASIYISIAVVLAAPAIRLEPFVYTLVLGLPIGALLLAPREHSRRVVVDGPLMLLIAWIGMSLLWSYNPEFGVFQVRAYVPFWIGASLMSSLLPRDDALDAVKRGIAVAVGITIFALIFYPETRLDESDGIYLDDTPGWHGFFIHKNSLAPFLIFSIITILNFEKDRVRRAVSLAVLAVLLIGSDSATGWAAAIFLTAMYVWFRFLHRTDSVRRSTAYVVSSVALGLVGVMVAAGSLSIITNAAGKDLTFSGRTYIWNGVINAIQDRPLIGYGVSGTFRDTSSEITRSIYRDIGFHVPHPHNGTLEVWLDFGIIGVVLFAAVFITGVAKGVRLIRRRPQTAEWLLTLLAVQLLMGLSENVFLGAWIVYMGLARGIAQRELNDVAREDSEAALAEVLDARSELVTTSGGAIVGSSSNGGELR